MSPCKFGYCSFGLNIILKLVTIKLPCKVGTLRKLCSQVILFTIRYFSSPISTSCSRRPWICYLGTMDPNFSMLGRDRGSSKTIFGQSLFRFWFLWELLRNPTARFALLFFVVCGYDDIIDPVAGAAGICWFEFLGGANVASPPPGFYSSLAERAPFEF